MPSTDDEAARADLLDREISRYARKGYRVIVRTPTTAQLVRPKKFSLLWALIWTITVAGLPIYIIWYLAKRDSQIYLMVDSNGRIHRS